MEYAGYSVGDSWWFSIPSFAPLFSIEEQSSDVMREERKEDESRQNDRYTLSL
jgi:hypothetical protein